MRVCCLGAAGWKCHRIKFHPVWSTNPRFRPGLTNSPPTKRIKWRSSRRRIFSDQFVNCSRDSHMTVRVTSENPDAVAGVWLIAKVGHSFSLDGKFDMFVRRVGLCFQRRMWGMTNIQRVEAILAGRIHRVVFSGRKLRSKHLVMKFTFGLEICRFTLWTIWTIYRVRKESTV